MTVLYELTGVDADAVISKLSGGFDRIDRSTIEALSVLDVFASGG
jgi:hypothetical protein